MTDELLITVICREMPGRRFEDENVGKFTIREPVFLGIQENRTAIELHPGDAPEVIFRPVFRIKQQPDGSPNFLGPFAFGTPKQRFFYLNWLVQKPHAHRDMFRRAKIHLSEIGWQTVEKCLSGEQKLSVELRMTDDKGAPICATVKPSHATWFVTDNAGNKKRIS